MEILGNQETESQGWERNSVSLSMLLVSFEFCTMSPCYLSKYIIMFFKIS